MGDTTMRRPVASHFQKGVDFGLIIHKSPFMADEKDPLVLSNYIFRVARGKSLRAPNSGNLRRYTELQCPKARRRRLKAVQRLVRVLLGDPNIECGTKTKGEVC